MNLKESIKNILSTDGVVSYSYKTKIDDWMGNLKIFVYQNQTIVDGSICYQRFEDQNSAIDFYLEKIINKKNLALAIQGIRKYKLTDKDLDDVKNDEMKVLMKNYFDNYFKLDYP